MNKTLLKLIFLALLISGLSGCDGNPDSKNEISYSGLTNKTELTSTDVVNHFITAYTDFNIATLGQGLNYEYNRLSIPSIRSENNVEYGNCSTGTLQESGIDSGGEIDLLIIYDNYCDEGAYRDGRVALKGTGTKEESVATIQRMRYWIPTKYLDFTISGTINGTSLYEESYNGETDIDIDTDIYNIDITDNTEKTQYRFLNLTQAVDWSLGHTIISGRMFSEKHGYITIQTVENLVYHSNNTTPTSGKLILYGQNSKARVIFNGEGVYTIELNSDNNDNFGPEKNYTYN